MKFTVHAARSIFDGGLALHVISTEPEVADLKVRVPLTIDEARHLLDDLARAVDAACRDEELLADAERAS